MKKYIITGMSCAACQVRVEKAVSKLEGVESCAVNLLTNTMSVNGTAESSAIIKAVQDAGYGASPKDSIHSSATLANDMEKRTESPILSSGKNLSEANAAREDALIDRETPALKKRLVASLGFLIILMYISMGHTMWGFPLPKFFDGNHLALGILQLILSATVMVINQKFFISGFKALIHGSPNMDTLVALGSMASFVWSDFVLFAMTAAQLNGNHTELTGLMHNLYFESAAMIVSLITVGKMLEARSKGRTTDALKGIMKLAPKTAISLDNGAEIEVPVEQIKVGDIFVVKPGASIPVDGVVETGTSSVDESAFTGESIPVDKFEGSQVFAATVNQAGHMICRATKVGEDTALAKIIDMVSDAAATKAPIAKIADKVSGIFVPAVMAISIVTMIIWLFAGQELGFVLARGIAVLVISCPCALGLATPVSIMVGSGVGAKNGILFKTAVSLEETGKAQFIVLDKTGTITEGVPTVKNVIAAEGFSEKELIRTAAALEKYSEHSLAKAIVDYAAKNDIDIYSSHVDDFEVLAGSGLRGIIDGLSVVGGNLELVEKYVSIDNELLGKADELSRNGKTPLFFLSNEKLIGVIAVADSIKEESPAAIKELKDMGIEVIMLSGDNQLVSNAIAEQVGIKNVIAGVKPDGKESAISELKERGKVIMVGDGINDAPALTRADMGIAIGAGTDIAIDAADVVLMNSKLSDVPAAIKLSRATLRNIYENLFWAFIYNIIGIPLAAGAWIHITGWTMNPMFGAAAMSLSSFCVVSNALRLNFFDLHSRSKNKKIGLMSENKMVKEEEKMEKTIKIEGMMCAHCEASVKKALEALEAVNSAKVSHESGEAIVEISKALDDEVLKKTIEDKDYTVTSIR